MRSTECQNRRWHLGAELLLVFAVIAGFVDLCRVFFTVGYLPPPFVFDIDDTFMDWFNVAYWSHNRGAYSVYHSVYTPLSFVITQFTSNPLCYINAPKDARNCDLISIVQILVIYCACIIVTWLSFYKIDRKTAMFRTINIALGLPMLFALERGNLILHAYFAFVLLFGNIVVSKTGQAIVAAFVINLKSYLLLAVLIRAANRDWRAIERAMIATAALYLLSLGLFGSGTITEIIANLKIWFNVRGGVVWDDAIFSTSYSWLLLLDDRQYPVRDFISQRVFDSILLSAKLLINASQAVSIVCLVAAWLYPKTISPSRLAFFALMQSFVIQNPGGYSTSFVVFLICLEQGKNIPIGIAIAMAYLVSIPIDRPIALLFELDRTSWLGQVPVVQQYTLPISALVRPGLLLIMLWALAFDTLRKVHTAAKSDLPSLGLRLAESRNRSIRASIAT